MFCKNLNACPFPKQELIKVFHDIGVQSVNFMQNITLSFRKQSLRSVIKSETMFSMFIIF